MCTDLLLLTCRAIMIILMAHSSAHTSELCIAPREASVQRAADLGNPFHVRMSCFKPCGRASVYHPRTCDETGMPLCQNVPSACLGSVYLLGLPVGLQMVQDHTD